MIDPATRSEDTRRVMREFGFHQLPVGPVREKGRDIHDLAVAMVAAFPDGEELTSALSALSLARIDFLRDALDRHGTDGPTGLCGEEPSPWTRVPKAEAEGLREHARRERADGKETLARVLEDMAEHGDPDLALCVPWEEVRDAHHAKLGVERPADIDPDGGGD